MQTDVGRFSKSTQLGKVQMWNLASAGLPAEIQFSDRLHIVSSNPYKSLVKNIHATEVLMIMAGDFLYTSVSLHCTH